MQRYGLAILVLGEQTAACGVMVWRDFQQQQLNSTPYLSFVADHVYPIKITVFTYSNVLNHLESIEPDN